MTSLHMGQLRGACVICAAVCILYVTRAYVHHCSDAEDSVPATLATAGTLWVELDGDVRHRGIYFLPPESTVADLLLRADAAGIERLDRRHRDAFLNDGGRIVVTRTEDMELRMACGVMSNAKRYVLDLPIDVNTASVAELMLVPGIGKYTAGKIARFRERCGGVNRLDELKSIPAIGAKKFDIIRKNFCVGVGQSK